MMSEMKGAASALGAKTARACDSCLKVRARWYCAADDAFLCHGCDNSVHSANQLASRHERVRLQSASSKVTTTQAWHSGFTRKARTPRQKNHNLALQQRFKEKVLFNNTSSVVLPLVPELGGEEQEQLVDDDESEEQLLFRVPVFEPFDAEPCIKELKYNTQNDAADDEEACNLESFCDFDVDLAEFAASVESLLGNGVHEDLGEVFNYTKEDEIAAYVIGDAATSEKAKVKDEELDTADTKRGCHLESVLDITSNEAFEWNIDSMLQEEKEAVVASNSGEREEGTKRDMFLRLNYEEVITAWASQGSPWTTGNPPKFNSDEDFLPNCMVFSSLNDLYFASSNATYTQLCIF